MIKIAVDGRVLQHDRAGMSRAVINLIRSLSKYYSFHILLNNPIIGIPELKDIAHLHYAKPASSILSFFWDQISVISLLKSIKPHIYHAPYNFGLPFIKLSSIKYVLTLHDLIPIYFPDNLSKLEWIQWQMGIRISLITSDCIIADSHYTKSDIINFFPGVRNKINVVYNFIDDIFQNRKSDNDAIAALKRHYKIDTPYIFYHGGFRRHKNVDKLIKSFAVLQKLYNRNIKLCIAGYDDIYFKKIIYPCIHETGMSNNIILTGYIPDEHLVLLLCGAAAFVYLSEAEGFGYPPLEALACGTPVICAKNSSLPELLGDSVQWVTDQDPPEKIAEIIYQTIIGQNNINYSSMMSFENINKFRSSRYVASMKNLYDNILL